MPELETLWVLDGDLDAAAALPVATDELVDLLDGDGYAAIGAPVFSSTEHHLAVRVHAIPLRGNDPRPWSSREAWVAADETDWRAA